MLQSVRPKHLTIRASFTAMGGCAVDPAGAVVGQRDPGRCDAYRLAASAPYSGSPAGGSSCWPHAGATSFIDIDVEIGIYSREPTSALADLGDARLGGHQRRRCGAPASAASNWTRARSLDVSRAPALSPEVRPAC